MSSVIQTSSSFELRASLAGNLSGNRRMSVVYKSVKYGHICQNGTKFTLAVCWQEMSLFDNFAGKYLGQDRFHPSRLTYEGCIRLEPVVRVSDSRRMAEIGRNFLSVLFTVLLN